MCETDDRQIVLVVDDTPENIRILDSILSQHYRVKVAPSGDRALKIVRQSPPPDLVLLAVMMPAMNGHDVVRRLKADPVTAKIPVIFITAKTAVEDEQAGLALGAIDYITEPFSPAIVAMRVQAHLALSQQQRSLERLVRDRTRELHETRLEIIRRLGGAAEFRDNDTGHHVERISHYARLIARALSMPDDWASRLFHAAAMHDVGKIGIPDRVLLKPGKLTAAEWQIVRCHPEIGARIIGDHPSDLIQMCREVALTHHEKWDGSGYPNGLAQHAIPLSGRIVALADVFDALVSERPYKRPLTVAQAVALIERLSGVYFDPDVVTAFDRCLPNVMTIMTRFADTLADPGPAPATDAAIA